MSTGRGPWLRRLVLVAAWTATLGGLLFLLDRAALGPEPPRGWTTVATLEEIPASAGPVLVPAYLPRELAWPPHGVRYWADGGAGWWLEVRLREDDTPWLWIGSGAGHTPRFVPQRSEPGPPWHRLSRRVAGQVVVVLTRLPPQQALRVLDGLELAGAGP